MGEGKGRIGRVGRMNCVVVALDVLVGVGLAVGSGPGAPVDVVPVVRQLVFTSDYSIFDNKNRWGRICSINLNYNCNCLLFIMR